MKFFQNTKFMSNLIRSSVKTITVEYATELMKHNFFNRPLNKITVEDYKSQIVRGLWRLNGESIKISDKGNLMDGQHRLTAIIESGIPVKSLVVEGVDEKDFATIDTGRTRTISDLFNIDQVQNASQISAIITAYFRLLRSNNTSASNDSLRKLRLSKGEILEYYRKNALTIQDIHKFCTHCRSKLPVMTITEMGAFYLYLTRTLNHPYEKVEAFFKELVGLHPVTNSTVTVLHDSLIKGLAGKISFTPNQRRAYIIKTWNAYVKGKELKTLSYSKEKESFIHFI